ncbi:MAG: DUF4270 family protein [Cytophagales bacterium]
MMKWSTMYTTYTTIWQVNPENNMLLKSWLVRLIVPAFFLWSCTNKENISAPDIGNGDNLKAILVDTFNIETSTFLRDSIVTSSASTLLVGKVENENFGTTTCNAFLQTAITGNNFLNIENPQFDSMILVLRPNYVFGNPDASIKMGVHRLKEGFDLNKSYLASESLEYDKDTLAEVIFSAQDIQDENLRINLSELGKKFFNDRELEFFDDPLDFIEYFKGLALITKTSEGSVIGFEVDPASSTTSTITSGIFLYYRTSVDSTADTTFYKFPISVNYQRFNQISHDRPPLLSDLKANNQKISSELTNDEVFLLAGTGIISRFDFPTFKNLRNLHRSIIVEQAILSIDANVDNDDYYSPPLELFLFKVDSNDNLDLYNGGEVGSGSRFNNTYSLDVTSYFGELISSRESVTDLIVIPSLNGSSVNQLKFGAYKDEGSPVKLIVYYIPIN